MPLWQTPNLCLTTVRDRLSVMSRLIGEFKDFVIVQLSPHRPTHENISTNIFFNITPPMKLSKYSERQRRRERKKYPIMAFFPTIFHVHDSKIAWSFSFGWALKAVERVFYFSSQYTIFSSASIKLFRRKIHLRKPSDVYCFVCGPIKIAKRKDEIESKCRAFTWNEKKEENC